MTRIVAGAAKGRRISVPPRGTRPTSDRVRESLFSSLDSELISRDESWSDAVVLDLYAGSGALGLEALSRGARAATFVESDRTAVRVLRDNVAGLDLPGASVVPRRVERLADLAPVAPATLVLVDPPYSVDALEIAGSLTRLRQVGWIDEGALLVVERPTRDELSPLPSDWVLVRRRTYGDTALWYGRAHGNETPDDLVTDEAATAAGEEGD